MDPDGGVGDGCDGSLAVFVGGDPGYGYDVIRCRNVSLDIYRRRAGFDFHREKMMLDAPALHAVGVGHGNADEVAGHGNAIAQEIEERDSVPTRPGIAGGGYVFRPARDVRDRHGQPVGCIRAAAFEERRALDRHERRLSGGLRRQLDRDIPNVRAVRQFDRRRSVLGDQFTQVDRRVSAVAVVRHLAYGADAISNRGRVA